MFLGPETSHETLKRPKSRPRDTQGPPKRHAKIWQKNPKKCCLGKKCLKPAISFWGLSGPHFWWLFLLTFKLIFGLFFDNFLKHFGAHFGIHFGTKLPKRGQDEPKRAIRSFKEVKNCMFKNLKKPLVFKGFWLQRPLRRASRGPRRLPKGTPKPQNPKTPKPHLHRSFILKNYMDADKIFWTKDGSNNNWFYN